MFKWLKRLFAKDAIPAAGSDRATTEFSAEVVRISSVTPHPNADRLELIRFEMAGLGESGYEVVSQKGSWKPGDLAAYFSVDCILPTSHPEFQFLTTRLDGVGKTHYRLKAARLRGVFSQGLLVTAPSTISFGASCAEHFGVTYYSPDIPEPASNGGAARPAKKKPQPMPIYGVDSLKKNPRLFDEGEAVYVTEKIHGTNFRFGWVRRRVLGIPVGWRFVVGSHRVIKGEGKATHFYDSDLWTEAARKMGLEEATRTARGHVFFGELYGHTYTGERIQDLTYGRFPDQGPGLAIFDVLGPRGYLLPEAREELCRDLGLPMVPVLVSNAPFGGWVEPVAEGVSRLDPLQIREGVVVESLVGTRKKAKFVAQQYLLRKEAA